MILKREFKSYSSFFTKDKVIKWVTIDYIYIKYNIKRVTIDYIYIYISSII